MDSENNKLIVPMNVEALCIGNTLTETTFCGPTADFSDLPRYDGQKGYMVGKPYIHESINRFATETFKVGIHLHWALPEALTKGLKEQNSEQINFPAVPNRWLITRLHQTNRDPQNPIIDIRNWILESDYLPNNSEPMLSDITPISIPDNTNKNQCFNFLGRVYPLENYAQEKGKGSSFQTLTGKKFTVIGYGEISFAAYYPNCKNIFGFYDNLKDLVNYDPDNNQITYTVIGWYTDSNDDPLSKKDINFIENIYKWTFDDKTKLPQSTICHGSVQNIKWDPHFDYFKDESENEIRVSIGNNVAEALSALIANDPSVKDKSNTEYLLNALQTGLISKTQSDPDWISKLDEEMHMRAFSFSKADVIWVINHKKDKSASQEESPDQLIQLPKNIHFNLTEEIMHDLNALNISQDNYNKLIREIDTKKNQLFFDWYKYTVKLYAHDTEKSFETLKKLGDETIDINILHTYLKQAINLLNEKTDQLNNTAITITNQVEALKKSIADLGNVKRDDFLNIVENPLALFTNLINNGYLNQDGVIQNKFQQLKEWTELSLDSPYESKKKEIFSILDAINALKDAYILTTTEGARFWQSNNPVLLLGGEDVRPSCRYGGEDKFYKDGKLFCRLEDTITSQVSILNEDNVPFTINTQDFDFLPNLNDLPFSKECSLLIAESIFINPYNTNFITTVLKKKGGDKNPAVLDFSETVKNIQATLDDYLSHSDNKKKISFQGTAPNLLALNRWEKNPWIPLFLNWSIDYYPIQYIAPTSEINYEEIFILENYEFSENGTDLILSKDNFNLNVTSYSRTISLNKNVFTSLNNELDVYLKYYSEDEELKKIRRELTDLPILAQALNGFNEALVMQKNEIQLEIRDPFSSDIKFTHKIKDAVGNNNTASPMFLEAYNPIRGGFLKIANIHLIDAFGRRKKIKMEYAKITPAQNLTSPNPHFINYAYLPPRLTQPCRLLFKWLSANDDQMQSNSYYSSSPICGWLLPNFLENNLMIYDQEGKLVGTFQLNAEKTKLLWFFPPVVDEKTLTIDDEVIHKIKQLVNNTHLQKFIINLIQQPTTFFVDFMISAEKMLLFTEPASYRENQGQSLLLGKPLVLIRTSLNLELYGDAFCEQSWNALAKDINADKRTKRDFDKVKFPINLGAQTQINDGLIGYFKEKDNQTDYSTFYTHGTDATVSKGVTKPSKDTLLLDCDSTGPTKLTLVMDPFGSVTAYSGILPSKSISIPPYYYTNILKNICTAFLTAPVLYGTQGLTIPLSQENNYFWSFYFTADDKWNEIIPSTNTGILNYSPQKLIEGWLKLNEKDD